MSDTAIIINTAVAVLAARPAHRPVPAQPGDLVGHRCRLPGAAQRDWASKAPIEAITTGFGDIMAEVGLLIAFGVLIGAMLQEAGAIQRLVSTLMRMFGPKRMPYALSLTLATALQSIFLDVLLVISAPLARNLAPRIGRMGTARMATALAIGLECGIVLMVPGVGTLALAGLLGVPLGRMLIFGLILIIPTVALSVAIMSFVFRHGWWDAPKDEQPGMFGDEATGAQADGQGQEPAKPTEAVQPAIGATQTGRRREDGCRGQQRGTVSLIVLFAPLLVALRADRRRRHARRRRHREPGRHVRRRPGDRPAHRADRHEPRHPLRGGREAGGAVDRHAGSGRADRS